MFRPVNKGNKVAEKALTENAVWWIVRKYAGDLDFGTLAPHDLRRTCARLCRESGGALEQIQLLLGHESIQTRNQTEPGRSRERPARVRRVNVEESAVARTYAALLADIKDRIERSQVRAAVAINRELVLLYWGIGAEISRRQRAEG